MRYFAMIGGERRGPYELTELAEAGVRPDTYVWCKGMDDWEKAEDVADICRFYRQRIFDIMHPSSHPAPATENTDREQSPLQPTMIVEEPTDTSHAPLPTLFISILITFFCFPITGLVAVYYSYKSREAWRESLRSNSNAQKDLYSNRESEQLRIKAHDYCRKAKMWIGISFFLSFIVYAFVSHRLI